MRILVRTEICWIDQTSEVELAVGETIIGVLLLNAERFAVIIQWQEMVPR